MKPKSITAKLFFSICALIIISLLTLSLTLSIRFSNDYVENKTAFVKQNLYKSKQSVDYFIKSIEKTADILCDNIKIKSELKGETYHFDINELINDVISVQESINNIILIRKNGEWATTKLSISNDVKEYVNTIVKLKDKDNMNSNSSYYFPKDFDNFYFAKPVFDSSTQKYIGTLILDISKSYLRELLLLLYSSRNDKVCLLDSNGTIIINHPIVSNFDSIINEHPVLTKSSNVFMRIDVFGIDSLVASSTVGFSNWKIVSITSLKEMNSELFSMRFISACILLVFIVLSIISAHFLSSHFTRPILTLNNKIISITKDYVSSKELQIDIKKGDEFKQLNESFDKMVEKQQELFNKILASQKRESELQFEVLHAQINPHFLYNTLDTVKWMVLIGNTDNIENFINSLINLLRYNISSNKLTTLKKEIQSVKNYVFLQRYKYGNIFSIEYKIDDLTEECVILRLILQPLVENAIFHAFDQENENGIITISSKIEDEKLIIEVADNGTGFSTTNIDEITNKNANRPKYSNIGLNNLNERIKLYYGDGYFLKINNRPNKGAVVTMVLPVLYKDEQ